MLYALCSMLYALCSNKADAQIEILENVLGLTFIRVGNAIRYKKNQLTIFDQAFPCV